MNNWEPKLIPASCVTKMVSQLLGPQMIDFLFLLLFGVWYIKVPRVMLSYNIDCT